MKLTTCIKHTFHLIFILCSFSALAQIEQLPGKAIDIAGNDASDLYIISQTKSIMKYDFSNQDWKDVANPDANLKAIAVSRGMVFVMDENGSIYYQKTDESDWTKVSKAFVDVGGSARMLFALDQKGRLWKFNFNRNRFQEIKIENKRFTEVTVFANHAYINDENDVTYRVADGFVLKDLPGKCHDIEGSLKKLYKVGAENRINKYHYHNNEWTLQYQPKADFQKIGICNDIAYAIDSNKDIYRITDK